MVTDKQASNAYMLVYEQVKSHDRTGESLEPPKKIVEDIRKENKTSSKIRLRFDPLYFDFFKQIIHKISFDPVTSKSYSSLQTTFEENPSSFIGSENHLNPGFLLCSSVVGW